MEQVKCPGQDTRFWKPGDIFTAQCPKCAAEIEFFKDDTRRRCAWCGHLFYNPKIELGCAEWCQYAEKCVPELIKEKKADLKFRELLGEKVQAWLASDQEAWESTEKGVNYALDLLKAEGGDPKVVIAATLLYRVEPARAREMLAELETEPEITQAIQDLLTGQGAEADPNRQLFQDILALVRQEPETSPAYTTHTARRLAAGGGAG